MNINENIRYERKINGCIPTKLLISQLLFIIHFKTSFVVYLYVNGSGSITSVGEERANLSAVVYL